MLRATAQGQIPNFQDAHRAAEQAVDYLVNQKKELPADMHEWLSARLLEEIHDPGGHQTIAEPPTDFTPWLSENGDYLDTSRGKPAWKYWARYRAHLQDTDSTKGRGRSAADVDELDASSNAVLARTMDPATPGRWGTHGMVVGNVQSGKTQHYTALINKAADLGYKLIIVLAGVTNDLRWQTQSRLDREFRGFETWQEGARGLERIGVGFFTAATGDSDIPEPFAWTTSHPKKGDFSTMQQNLRVLLSLPKDTPVYLVVKKNKASLDKLAAHLGTVGRDRLAERPLLLIDDECDQASVNTKYSGEDARKEIEEDDPTVINGLIRGILNMFPRFSYIGYTATPFANIFIPHDPRVRLEDVDLYPRNFIMVLDPPKNYIGPSKVFGLRDEPQYKIAGFEPLGVIKHLPDQQDVQNLVENEKDLLQRVVLPGSLKEAILGFLVATAAHRHRMKKRQFATMLVHVVGTRGPQAHLRKLVESYMDEVRQSVLGNPASPHLERMRSLWEKDYVPQTRKLMDRGVVAKETGIPSFEDLVPLIHDDLEIVEVKLLNMDSPHLLDYRGGPEKTPPYIAVGGNKLSRGFTLEGLHTSYYLRNPNAADTLLQMGRWFGYRPGYVDFCRVHTTPEIEENFQYIANAIEQLRNKFREMAEHKPPLPPSEFAYAVRMHPASAIRVTALNKSRFAEEIVTSLRGRVHQTLKFDVDSATMKRNLEAAGGFLAEVRRIGEFNNKTRTIRHWTVPSSLVTEFLLGKYRVSPHDAYYFIADIMRNYINRNSDRLTHFVVGYHEPSGPQSAIPHLGEVPLSERRQAKAHYHRELRYVQLQGLDVRDDLEAGMTPKQLEEALAQTKTEDPKATNASRSSLLSRRDTGLLVFYFVDTKKSFAHLGYDGPDIPVAGFMAAFPDTNTSYEDEYTYLAGFVHEGRLA